MPIVAHGQFILTNPAWMLCFNLSADPADQTKIYRYTTSSEPIIQYSQPELPTPYDVGDFQPLTFDVSPIQHDNIGRLECFVSLNNLDASLSTAFLTSPDWRGNVLWISQFYVIRGEKPGDYFGHEGRLVFYGQMNSTRIDQSIEIEALGAGNFYGSAPRMTVRKPIFNWLPAEGTILAHDDNAYVIKRRS